MVQRSEFRKLLILAVNDATQFGKISLKPPRTNAPTDEDGHYFTELAGYPSVVLWNSISVGELRVTVWWNYDHTKHPQAQAEDRSRERFQTSTPLAKRSQYSRFVGATASGWLERKTSQHLQGKAGEGIFDTYLRNDMRTALDSLPDCAPIGFDAEGKFYL